ncbi:MAG: sulfurtransferase TusA family protein [Hyphomicrobiales bacterium]|nr:MAG: sulfurtransferase TusA family protein [Hyphomicrobiales bacterium]
MATQTLDAKGLNCPLPVLKTKKALKGLNAGETLEMVSTDAGSIKDIEALCRSSGDKLLESGEVGGTYRFLIEKA